MKWFGSWLLSLIVWIVVATIEAHYRESNGDSHANAINEGVITIRAGMVITGIVMLGVWCVWFS